MMSSSQPDCLTSIVSYAPDFGVRNVPVVYNCKEFKSPQYDSSALEVISVNNHKKLSSPPPLTALTPKIFIKSALKQNINNFKGDIQETSVVKNTGSDSKPIVHAPSSKGDQLKAKELSEKTVSSRLKKKTVAFGRTTNLSQTIEGSDLKKRNIQGRKNGYCGMQKSNETSENGHLVMEERLNAIYKEVEDLKLKDEEKTKQILKLTDIVKELTLQISVRRNQTKNLETHVNRTNNEKLCKGKENIPPGQSYDDESEIDETNRKANHLIVSKHSRPKKENKKDEKDDKLKLIQREMEKNPEFERYINEGIMRFGGDLSLSEIDQNIALARSRTHDRLSPNKIRHGRAAEKPVMRTTRVTKQMTVEEVQHSPARSAAFSYDTTKYLSRYGVTRGAYVDENDDEDDCFCVDDENCEKCLPARSLYKPGESTTYYASKNVISSPKIYRNRPIRGISRRRIDNYVENNANYEEDDSDVDPDDLLNEVVELDELEVLDQVNEKRDWLQTAKNNGFGVLNKTNRRCRIANRQYKD